MTSGEFQSLPIAEVWVNREARQRKELRDIEDLAESIARVGLINAIVVKRDGELVAGERRFTAIKSLGWTHIPVQFVDQLSELELHLIELEENIRRTDLTWQEECLAVEQYHVMRGANAPEWSAKDTAEAVGLSQSAVSQKIAVAKEIKSGNALVSEAPKFSTARGIVQRATDRRKSSAVDNLLGGTDEPELPIEPDLDDTNPGHPSVPLLNEDFHTWVKGYEGPKFNLLHCDFPYGVNADKHNQGSAKGFGGYADSPDVYWDLLNTLASAMDNVVADSAHLIFWFSMDFYHETKEILEGMGWRVNAFPLVWFKSDNTGILPDPSRGPRRVYETALFASRGDRLIVRAVSNTCAYAGREKSIHMSEKPRAMLTHFLRMVVDDSTRMLDPTAGSANAVAATEALGASQVLGLERDTTFFNLARENYYADETSTASED